MMSKRTPSALVSIALLAVLACSKTADTAPERRIFGSPPTIETVTPIFIPQAPVDCDFTKIVDALVCQNGILDAQPQTGRGWTKAVDPNDPNKTIVVFSDVPTTVPGTFIEGTYTELSFTVKVTDPESTAQQSNILLVSASYQLPPPSTTEDTLVLFDDGGQINFPFEQKALVAEDCTVDIPNQICDCGGAIYNIKSGDLVKGDGVYTRKFALANPGASQFLNDCIKRSKQEIPVPLSAGSTLQFKIEAVDRQGNLATWPTKLPAVVGTGSFVCNGDSCGCCLLHAFSQLADITECHGLPGLISPSKYPDGVCIDFIPGPG